MVNTESGRKRGELQVLLKDYQNQLTSESPDNLRIWEKSLERVNKKGDCHAMMIERRFAHSLSLYNVADSVRERNI